MRFLFRSAVVAVRLKPFAASDFGEATGRAAAAEHRDEIDGLGDQRAGDRDDGFLNELLEAAQRAERGAGVDGADAARVARPPRLEQIQRLGAAHLYDRNTIRSEERRVEKAGARRGTTRWWQ